MTVRKRHQLTKDQIESAQSLYKQNFGREIPLDWHELYYGVSGKFAPAYFPELLYVPVLERTLNDEHARKFFSNKFEQNIHFRSLDFIKTPRVVSTCLNGTLLGENLKRITTDELAKHLRGASKELFFKPLNEDSGRGCAVYKPGELTEEELSKLIALSKGNFIIQERLANHQSIAALHPDSLNTFRIITYRLNGRIYTIPSVLRLGRGTNFVDNAHAGGIFIGIEDDGSLLECAHTEFGDDFYEHPDSHIKFEGYRIEGFSKCLEAAKQMHCLLPSLGIVHWDCALNENEEPVFIESNVAGGGIWVAQMAHGKGPFGDNIAAILQYIRSK